VEPYCWLALPCPVTGLFAEPVGADCGPVGSDLTGLAAQLSDGKRVRDVYTRYALYQSTPLPLPFTFLWSGT